MEQVLRSSEASAAEAVLLGRGESADGDRQEQQRLRAAQDMQIMKARQKQLESQQKQLLGFDVADMSEVDKQTFGAKRDWLKGRIDNYYYGPQNYGQFVEDVNALKTLHAELKNHSDNVSTSMNNLEGWVAGTKEWTKRFGVER